MMEPHEEVGQLSKSDNQMINETTKQFEQFQQQEQAKLVETMKSETVQEFEKTRNLGFVTKQDIEGMITSTFTKYRDESTAMIAKQNQTIDELRHLIFRAKAQGISNGTTDQRPQDKPQDNPFMGMMYGRT